MSADFVEDMAESLDVVPVNSAALAEIAATLVEGGSVVLEGRGALCALPEHDPDWWFSYERLQQAKAISVCGQCPLRTECAETSLTEEHGIRGGLLPGGQSWLPKECKHGHVNSWKVLERNGRRICRACVNQESQVRRARIKAAAALSGIEKESA